MKRKAQGLAKPKKARNTTRTKKSILLGVDGTCGVRVDVLAEGLNRVCSHLRFTAQREPFDLGLAVVSNPTTYEYLSDVTDALRKKHDWIIIATDLPYDNNYFFDSDDDATSIVSFWGWSALTNLPKNNGMVGLIGSMLAQYLDSSFRHEENIGCVYDFLADKRGIDARLRNGSMCRSCIERLQTKAKRDGSNKVAGFDFTIEQGLKDLMTIFDEVSVSSRRQIDIIERWRTRAGVEEEFDVFLCHNSEDKSSVRMFFNGLKERHIRPWFDEEHLRPGLPWQDELAKMIPKIKSAAIIVGPNGQGPWQNIELRALIGKFADSGCLIIPVILKDVKEMPEIPLFLEAFTWVDFRKPSPDPWARLIWGITGQRPT